MEVQTDNYFVFFDLPISLNIELEELENRFYRFHKIFHPDFFLQASEEKKEQIIELASFNNKAYQTLKDPTSRLHYTLELLGMLADGEKNSLPQDFLMEMMEINEELMELQFDPDPVRQANIKAQIEDFEAQIHSKAVLLLAHPDALQLDIQQKQALKDYYYKCKYLRRIHDSLEKLA